MSSVSASSGICGTTTTTTTPTAATTTMSIVVVVVVVVVAELLKLCVHRWRCDGVFGVCVEWNLSWRVCYSAAVHDHAFLHDISHRCHSNATAHGHH